MAFALQRAGWYVPADNVARESSAPLVVSHANAKAIWDHPRNLDDAQLNTVGESPDFIDYAVEEIMGDLRGHSDLSPEDSFTYPHGLETASELSSLFRGLETRGIDLPTWYRGAARAWAGTSSADPSLNATAVAGLCDVVIGGIYHHCSALYRATY